MTEGTIAKRPELTIGGLSRRTGCKVETIRYYERIKMMPEPLRTMGGHRVYRRDDVKRLTFIRRSRELGFTLQEVRGLLRLVDGGEYSCAEVKTLTLDHAAEVRRKVTDLRKLERVLKEMAAQCDGGEVPQCPIVEALYQQTS